MQSQTQFSEGATFQPALVQAHLLNEIQAGAYLNLSPKTLATWRCTKRFEGPRYVKLGGAVRYPLRELDAFIERQLVPVAEEV